LTDEFKYFDNADPDIQAAFKAAFPEVPEVTDDKKKEKKGDLNWFEKMFGKKGGENPYKEEYPDATLEDGKWVVMRNGKKYEIVGD